ncbi:MAG: serine hydrolase [Nitrospirales bacterium]|nr:serine hydrolase [Nitrospirales bacterium]
MLFYEALLTSVFAFLILASCLLPFPVAAAVSVSQEMSGSIDSLVEKEISEGRIPGAVILMGNAEGVIYEKAFGFRAIRPSREAMTTDTIFDIASLTKVVATAPAVMQLIEQGRLGLNDPVCRYWPEFRTKGKEGITVRQLLTHYSGLQPDIPLKPAWSGYATAISRIEKMSPVCAPGTRFIYSDVNFIILGELVRRITRQPLDQYCAKEIFAPLRMLDSGFHPPKALADRIAPCDCPAGEVQDPLARAMGGVAGHAGVFSTARDLAALCTMILNKGKYQGKRILSPMTIEKMTTPQSPVNKRAVRGLGWDIDSPYSSNRGPFFSLGSFGHKGYTGTSLWIDPVSRTYVIVLTSRLHPDGKGNAEPLRERISSIVAASTAPEAGTNCPITGWHELLKGYPLSPPRNGQVMTGIEVLREEGFKPLAGLRIGLITNHTGRDAQGKRTADILARAPSVRLTAIFSPEHGMKADKDEKVRSSRDTETGLPVYSLYGETLRPTDEMLKGIDALVFDIQDIGARFYTYISTLHHVRRWR